MITIEQIEKVFGDNRTPFKKNINVDHHFVAISLLRERIPYDKCKSIIQGAAHDIIYLCDVDDALEYLSEEDLEILADCNMWYDEDNQSFALYV